MATATPEHPEWLWRFQAASTSILPWIEEHVPLASRTVLEYGCGQGAIACATAPRCARHIGVDIDADELDMARGHLARRGLENVELHAAPPAAILDTVRKFAGQVDVFLLYAVLEHLTVDERCAVLRAAREVTRQDGVIVVIETPNRLTPIDHHTGRMPFLHALPLDLAADVYRTSDRGEFVAALDTAAAAGDAALREALVRWGRGVSFHEFEQVFGDLAAHTLASSYDGRLYPYRPVRGEELQLAATLDAWRPDLPPCWSRTWLDMILSVRPRADGPPYHVRPWALRLPHDVPGAAMLADGRIELRPGARLPLTFEVPVEHLHVGLMAQAPQNALRIHLGEVTVAPEAVANEDGVPPWHAVARLPRAASEMALELADGGCITFVGYGGPPESDAAMRRPMGW